MGYGVAWAFLTALAKLVLYSFLNNESLLIISAVYFFVLLCTIAFVRRLGVINYLESLVVIVFWLLFSLTLDLFVVGLWVGLDPYTTLWFWLFYPFCMLILFLMHKKRHIDIRKGGAGK